MIYLRRKCVPADSMPLFVTVGRSIARSTVVTRKTTDIGLLPAVGIVPIGKAFVKKKSGDLVSLSLFPLLLQLAPTGQRLLSVATRLLQEGHFMESEVGHCDSGQYCVDGLPVTTYSASLMPDHYQRGLVATTGPSFESCQPSWSKYSSARTHSNSLGEYGVGFEVVHDLSRRCHLLPFLLRFL